MALTNNNKKVIDLPIFEWLRFAPGSSSALTSLCYGDTNDERYMYYMLGVTLYRYDTYTDGWDMLSNSNWTPTTVLATKYSTFGGWIGDVLSATSNTIRIPGLNGKILVGEKIKITSGSGAGQEKTITDIVHTTHDQGLATAADAYKVTDSTKNWDFNQWVGYQVRIIYGAGQNVIKTVTYNTPTDLYFADANYQGIDPWNNTQIYAATPYALPASTAGAQSTYIIESSVATVDTNWDIIPDLSSRFLVSTSLIYSISAAGFIVYDIASGTWINKTYPNPLVSISTDVVLERISRASGSFETGNIISASYKTVQTDLTLALKEYSNFTIEITSGTGRGQRRRIISNTIGTNSVLTVAKPWDVLPDNTSDFAIYGDVDKIYMSGNGMSGMFQYDVNSDLWSTGYTYEDGLAVNSCIVGIRGVSIGLSSGVRTTSSVKTLGAIAAAGTGYKVNDLVNITPGSGTDYALVKITSVSAGGVVTGVQLVGRGNNYTTGAKATTVVTGVGSGLQVNVATVGTSVKVTTALNHRIKIGDSVTIKGTTTSDWNVTSTVVGVPSITTFELDIAPAANLVNAYAQGTTTLVDSSKSWSTNEHIGKVVNIYTAGINPTVQSRKITANNATTLTLNGTITPAVNGTSRYVIQNPYAFGRDRQYLTTSKNGAGFATSGTTTTLVDSSKNWDVDQWVGYKFRVHGGTGFDNTVGEITITANDATSITFASAGFTPDTTTEYQIMDTFGTATSTGTTTVLNDTTKKWKVNQWAGKRMRIIAGTGQHIEVTIASNTSNSITATAAMGFTPDTTTSYTILGIQPRSTGTSLNWVFGESSLQYNGNYLVSFRGGATNNIDYYNIALDRWEYGITPDVRSLLLTTGSMYTYDGKDRIYIQENATGRLYSYNIASNKVEGFATIPYGMSTAITGNRMEFVRTSDGIEYLYLMRHSATEFWRTMIYWNY